MIILTSLLGCITTFMVISTIEIIIGLKSKRKIGLREAKKRIVKLLLYIMLDLIVLSIIVVWGSL